MNRNEKIKELLRRSFQEAPYGSGLTEMDERILSDASASMKQARATHGQAYRIFTWRNIMQGRTITKLAAAAVILIAAVVLINHFGGSINGSSVVFAEVIKSIQSANSAVWHEERVITCNDEELSFLASRDVVRYYSLEYGGKESMYNTEDVLLHQVYWLPEKDVRIAVVPLLKKYRRTAFTEAERAIGGLSVEAIVELVKSEKANKLGRKTVNGRKAEGFEIKDSKIAAALVPVQFDSLVARFWIDVETSLPVQYEAELVISDKYITVFTGGRAVEVKVTGDEFQWDVELKPGIFEPNIPSDYTPMEY